MELGDVHCRMPAQLRIVHGFEQNNMAQNLLYKFFKSYLQLGLDHVNQSPIGWLAPERCRAHPVFHPA
jgi:hypothetical protein